MNRGRGSGHAGPSWAWAVVGLALYVGGLGALRALAVAGAPGWPTWASVLAPVVAYALLALALLGTGAPARVPIVTAIALAAHAVLVAAAPVVAAMLPVPAMLGAGGTVTWDSTVLTALVVVCVAMLVAPLGGLLRPRARGVRGGPAPAVRPVPRPAAPATARPAMEPVRVLPRRADLLPAPGPAPTAPAVPQAPSVPLAAPGVVSAPPPDHPTIPVVADAPTAAPVASPALSAAAAEPDPRVAAVPSPEALEEVIRVSFDRVADQLPEDLFLIPRERVAANLLEPGALLVPRRLVLPQLVDGAVRVPWSAVVDQFPRQALAIPDSEVVERLEDGALDLPLDEVLGQLAPDLFALASPVTDVSDLENFPPPFQPHVPPPHAEILTAPEPEPEAAPEAAAPAVEVVAPGVPVIETPERLAARLAPVMGPLVVTIRTIGSVPVQIYRAPGLDEDGVVEVAARLMPFLRDAPLPAPLRQVTLWGHEMALVVTPIAPGASTGAVVMTATPRGAALGLLERFALQASADPVVAAPLAGGLERTGAGAPLLEVACPPGVRSLASHLGGPGAVAPLVLRDQDGLAVYAFLSRGMPGHALASLAAALHRALDGVVPPVDSIALRLAACRVLVRRIAGPGGPPALLVLGSVSIDRPGLARLDLERTAARLVAVVGG